MRKLPLLFLGVCLAVSPLYAQTDDWKTGVEKVKELIKSNPEEAADQAKDLLKGKNKKNIDLVLAIGRAYLEAEQYDQALKYAEMAAKVDNKSAAISLFKGDVAVAQEDPGRAGQCYEEAIYFDANCKEAYLKYADLYRGANPELAVQKLEDLRAIDPQNVDVDRKLARIHYANNDFAKAVEAYARFAETDASKEDDLTKYSFALFLTKDFEKSLAIADLGLKRDPKHTAFNRLRMYNFIDLKRYEEAKAAADAFFGTCAESDFTYLDYLYHGYLLSSLKIHDQAIVAFEKALTLNPERSEAWKELSSCFEGVGKYKEAIEAYNKYYEAVPVEQRSPMLNYELGQLYYAEGTAEDTVTYTPEMKVEALKKADAEFAKLAELVPDNYLGNFWRARTNSVLDPETTQGLAKPYYEQVATLLVEKQDPRYNRYLIECYRYLGYYYLVAEKYEESKDYWSKILAIDPNDAIATKALEGIK